MTDRNIELSRRKILGAAGAIGIAGAGAGMGTSALFSDEESFTNNSIEAGTLDLIVDYETSVDQDGVDTGSTTGGSNAFGGPAQIDGNPASGEYVIKDLKPGDSGELLFCPKIVDNPGWLWVGSVEGLTGFENGQTEPEEDVDGSAGGSNNGEGQGELAEAIEVDVSYINSPTPGDERELNNPDGYTLADLFKELESGFLLDGEPYSGDPSGTQAYPSSPNDTTQTGPCLRIQWEVPTGVGNEIQSDSLEFDITFAAFQERNNPVPENPFADVTVGPGESIQTAIDDADPANVDIISVHGGVGGGVSVAEQVVVDDSFTIARAGAARPVIDGDGSSPAISIEADGVTVDGFDVTNPDELLGIKVEVGYDDVTICNNRVHDIGPTGTLGVTGIIVGNGDHDGISIQNNIIENLDQETTSSSRFPTVNGILFDADNNPGSISNIAVNNNVIRDVESDIAPLGIVVQQETDGAEINNNEIRNLVAADSTDSDQTDGVDFGFTFAQGINIASPSTADTAINGNLIENITSAEAILPEAVKIDGDGGGLTFRQNQFLVAVGLNNRNGTDDGGRNPSNDPLVDAKNNWWGSSNGPEEADFNQDADDDGRADVVGKVTTNPFLTSPPQ
jgi:predicted ribosomally synthesized peptide with SipW-like signal peptide